MSPMRTIPAAVRGVVLGTILLFAGNSATIAQQAATAWQLLDDGDPPPGDGILVYDATRQRAVRTRTGGGDSPQSLWELSGEDWVRRFLPEPTPWASGGCAAFDPTRGVTVLFGGVSSSETWEYNGIIWTRKFPTNSPSVRTACGMTYDSARNRIVLFGGHNGSWAGIPDTWEYNGTNWSLVNSPNPPPQRGGASIAFDVSRGKAILFGGRHNNTFYSDTWEYDGHWKQKNPSTLPPARTDAGMAYDAGRDRMVMFGGSMSSATFSDTWEWNGTNWTLKSPLQAPSARYGFDLVYESSRLRILGHGGIPDNSETWAYNGTTWSRVAVSDLPSGRGRFGMAYDQSREASVMYGGYSNGVQLNDTWQFEGGHWNPQSSAGAPVSTFDFPLAFDSLETRTVGFSGSSPTGFKPDVHEYVGVPGSWTSWVSGPDPRGGHGWVAGGFGGVLLFGGYACCVAGSSNYLANDTWLLQGLNWIPIEPAQRPSPREWMGIAYQDAIGKVFLYGGTTAASSLDGRTAESWLFDGTNWQFLSDPSPPGPRAGLSLSYDPLRQRIVLYGDGPPLEGVTWEFDGLSWAARTTAFQPDPDRCMLQTAWDPKREVVLLFGGRDCTAQVLYNDTWAYGADPDRDGKVGALDNCRFIANAGQTDGDGDGAGDICDCAPAAPNAFNVPSEVTGVSFSADRVTLSWVSAAPGAGTGTVHDVVRGRVTELPVGTGQSEICLAAGLAGTTMTESALPPVGTAFWYLVRGRNVCGAGTYGFQSSGGPRNTTACP